MPKLPMYYDIVYDQIWLKSFCGWPIWLWPWKNKALLDDSNPPYSYATQFRGPFLEVEKKSLQL
jgi:hypothetical protein